MARTLQQLQADRDKLTVAIANPNRRVQADGKSTEKHSVDDLIKARSAIDDEIAAMQRASGRIARSVVTRGT